MYVLLHLAILAATIFILARLLPSVRIKSAGTAVIVAIVFSVLNFFLGWFIRALLFVPALLTLGLLFIFVPFIVNTVILWLTDKLLAGFRIENTRSLLISAAVITAVNAIFYAPLLRAVAEGHGYDQPAWILYLAAVNSTGRIPQLRCGGEILDVPGGSAPLPPKSAAADFPVPRRIQPVTISAAGY